MSILERTVDENDNVVNCVIKGRNRINYKSPSIKRTFLFYLYNYSDIINKVLHIHIVLLWNLNMLFFLSYYTVTVFIFSVILSEPPPNTTCRSLIDHQGPRRPSTRDSLSDSVCDDCLLGESGHIRNYYRK